MKANCVTHHYACDCREEIFKENQDKLKLALEVIEKLKKSNDFYADKNNWNEDIIDNFEDLDGNKSPVMDDYCVTGGKLARQTQKEVNEMMEKINDKRS